MASAAQVRAKFVKWGSILTTEKTRLFKIFPAISRQSAAKEFSALLTLDSAYPAVLDCLADYPETGKMLLAELVGREGGPMLLINLRKWFLNPICTAKKDQQIGHFLNSLLFKLFNNPQDLALRQVVYQQASTQLVEFLAKADKVRPPKNLADLERRLSLHGSLRCFAYFHKCLTENEPLCFMHVALSSGFIDRAKDLFTDGSLAQQISHPTVATFYSLNSPFVGLYGLANFGRSLIIDVANTLRQQHPTLESFCTLSPIPGFSNWAKVMNSNESEKLPRLCRDYLNPDSTTDPVARFHYRNGAKLRAVLLAADDR